MKKTIRKIAVLLICIMTVMSFTSGVYAGINAQCPNCGSYDTRAPRINTGTLVRVCPNEGWTNDHMYTYAQYEGIFCNNCSYQQVGKYLGTNYVAECFVDGQEWYVIKGATHAQGYDFHECYGYWTTGSRQ